MNFFKIELGPPIPSGVSFRIAPRSALKAPCIVDSESAGAAATTFPIFEAPPIEGVKRLESFRKVFVRLYR